MRPIAAGRISDKPLILMIFHRFRHWPDDCRTEGGYPENQTVPPVASDATAPSYKPSLPNPAWAAPSSGRVSDSPFDALLDDSTQAAAQAAAQPPQSPPVPRDINPARTQSDTDQTTGPDQPNAPPKAAGSGRDQPSDSADSTDAGNANAAGTAKASQDTKSGKQTGKLTDEQTVKQAATGDDSKSAVTAKQADTVSPAIPTVTAATNAIQTVLPATVIAPVVSAQDAPATVLQAAAASGHLSITGADTTKAKTVGGADDKTDAAKLPTNTNASVKNTDGKPQDGKPQAAAGDADKQVTTPQQAVAQPGKSHAEAAPAQPASAPDAQSAQMKMDGGAVQQAALSMPTPDASQTAAASATPPAAQALAVPLAGVAIEIAGRALEGKNHFEIRLDPPELGRIEVRLDVDRNGNATTHMIADRSDTLNLLRNDSSDLQRALQDAGLKTSDNGMQFSLRDQSMGQQQSNTPTPGAAQIVVNDNTLAAIDITPRSYTRLAGMGGGIDIRV